MQQVTILMASVQEQAALYLFLVTLQTVLNAASGRSQLFDTRPFLIKTRRTDPYTEQYFTRENFNPDTDIQSYQPVERLDQFANDQNILTDSYGNQVHHQINFPPSPDPSYDPNQPNQIQNQIQTHIQNQIQNQTPFPDQTSNSLADENYNQYSQYNPSSNRGTPFNNFPPSASIPSTNSPPIQNYNQPPNNQFNNYRNTYREEQFPPEYRNPPGPNSVPTGPSNYQSLPAYPPYGVYDQNYQKPLLVQPPYKQPFGGTVGAPPTSNAYPPEEYPTDAPPLGYPPTGPGNYYDTNYQNFQSPTYGATNQNYSPPRPFDIPSPIIINSLQYPSGPAQSSGPRSSFERPFQSYQYGANRGVVNPLPPPPPPPPPPAPPIQSNYQYNQFDPRLSYQETASHGDVSNYQSTQNHAQIADSPRQNVFLDPAQPRGKSYRRPFSGGQGSNVGGSPSNYVPRGMSKSQRKTYSRGHHRVPGGSYRQNSPPPFGPSFETPGPSGGGAYQTLPQKMAPDGSYIY